MGQHWSWSHMFAMLFDKTVLFTFKWVWKIHFSEVRLLHAINHKCSPCIVLGWVFILARVSSGKMNLCQRELNQGSVTWVAGYGWLFGEEKHCPSKVFLPETSNLSTETEDIPSPKTMSSLTCFRGNINFSSSLSGWVALQLVLGNEKFQ